jgi:hypothetical protein
MPISTNLPPSSFCRRRRWAAAVSRRALDIGNDLSKYRPGPNRSPINSLLSGHLQSFSEAARRASDRSIRRQAATTSATFVAHRRLKRADIRIHEDFSDRARIRNPDSSSAAQRPDGCIFCLGDDSLWTASRRPTEKIVRLFASVLKANCFAVSPSPASARAVGQVY